jgi:hypothetical protein
MEILSSGEESLETYHCVNGGGGRRVGIYTCVTMYPLVGFSVSHHTYRKHAEWRGIQGFVFFFFCN